MHELSLSQGIVDLVCRHAAQERARRVLRVRVAIGALSHVEPDAIEFSFDVVSRGTPAEGAILEIDRPPGRAYCVPCETEVMVEGLDSPCPRCGTRKWVLTGGDELRVLELEVD